MTSLSPSAPAYGLEPMVANRRGVYLFCCARSSVLAMLDADGLEPGQRLRAVLLGDIAALTCEVLLSDWIGPLGEAHLTDLAWLGPRALRHEAVLELAMAKATLLPLPLGTLFSTEAAMLSWLKQRRGYIDEFLKIVADKEEWSIKGIVDMPRAEGKKLAADPRLQRLPAGGARYLLERKLRAEVAQQVRQEVKQAEAVLLARLSSLTLSRRIRRILPQQAADPPQQVMFHSALLIPASGRAELYTKVAEFNGEQADSGLRVELSGPWPPSSFIPSLMKDAGESGNGDK